MDNGYLYQNDLGADQTLNDDEGGYWPESSGAYENGDEERRRLFELYDTYQKSTASVSETSAILDNSYWNSTEGYGEWGSFGGPIFRGYAPAFLPCLIEAGYITDLDELPANALLYANGSTCNYSEFELFGESLRDYGFNKTAHVSSYEPWQVIFLGLIAAATSIITVAGNLIVILSFVIERSIRQPTNYFIASLAVSDLLIGSISMPFYTVYLLTDKYWPLGPFLCDLWLSLDYTVCLCSIYTVFCITIDRYCSVSIPAKYRNWRTEWKVLAMIAATWSVPTLLFFSSIFGWQYIVGERTVPEGKCYVQYMDSSYFSLVLQISYFWTTLVVMCILYTGIYRVASTLASRSAQKHKQTTTIVSAAGKTMTKIGLGVSSNQKAGAHGSGDERTRLTILSQGKTHGQPGNGKGLGVSGTSGGGKDGSSSPGFPSDSSQSGGSVAPKRNGDTVGAAKGESAASGALIKLQPPPSGKERGNVGNVVVEAGKLTTSNTGSRTTSTQISSDNEIALSPITPSVKQNHFSNQESILETCNECADGNCEHTDNEDANTSLILHPNSSLVAKKYGSCERQDSKADIEISVDQPDVRNHYPPSSNQDDDEESAFTFPEPDQISRLKVKSHLSEEDKVVVVLSSNQRLDVPNTRRQLSSQNSVSSLFSAAAGKLRRASSSSHSSSYRGSRTPSFSRAGKDRNDHAAGKQSNAPKTPQQKITAPASGGASKSENRARKALRTITIILGAFILCWTPWHVLAMIIGFTTDLEIYTPEWVSGLLYDISYWLCYLNSPINPFCYALANQQFKKTFTRILHFDWHRT